ncbi:GYDIA family GHMP kinase [Aequorivita sp. SDUM287046]|uniref:GYDIA family GHMP kinase n=1 Tax=Aequorivita aurantiaca TaxID=3053356 RepID=A0ABT8DHF8_9FLAO|nr:GYDIA family GHMP kinase [Aequorivita aurantiaca]MDN3724846.1 GYDIA family GHMP kinase [Aequorivita aurantiaca]
MRKFHSNGKLLLTGEYVVLDGASALAFPTKYGQSLEVENSEKERIHWQSFDEKGEVWFEEFFDLKNFENQTGQAEISNTLSKILREARNLNPDFLIKSDGINIKTKLDFPRIWGLGTSSTLINNIAQWAAVNPFDLLKNSFGGSGYDIAAAQSDAPILYELKNKRPEFRKVHLPWDFTDSLFFVHLNKKQDSKEGIERYRNASVRPKDIENISDISKKLLQCRTLKDFENLMESHEKVISEIIKMESVKQRLFPNFNGIVKSLGAWGGDFVLATGAESEMDYFRNKGFGTIISFSEMVKQKTPLL